jgi:hypothetical protein
MRINDEDRRLIARLAEQEERPASDAIRRLIRKAVKENERQSPTVSQAVGASAQTPITHP